MDLLAIPLAHAGHWAASLIYLAPVALIVGGLLVQSMRDRRHGVDADSRGGGDAPER